MCLQNTVIYSLRWNWDGDRIVPETIVPSGRLVVPEVTIPANLNKAVQRNLERFPADFMLQLTLEEAQMCLPSRFQSRILKRGRLLAAP